MVRPQDSPEKSDNAKCDLRMNERAKRNWLLFGGGVAFSLLVVGVLLMNIILVSMDYDKAKKEYLVAGLPFEAKDMPRNVPEQENAAGLLSKYKHTSAVSSADVKFDNVKAHKEELKKLVEERRTELDAVVAAAKLKHLDWQADWTKGAYLDLSQGIPLKSMVRDLATRAEIKSIEGDVQGALSDFRSMCRISEMASQEPTLIAMLVSTAIRAIVCSYARKVGSYRLNEPEFLRSISDELAVIQPGPDMVNAIKGEAYFNVWHLRNIQKMGGWIKALSNPEDYWNEMGDPVYKGPFDSDGDVKGMAARAMAVKAFRFYSDLQIILQDDQSWVTATPKISKRLNQAMMDESLSGRHLAASVGIYDKILNVPATSQATVVTTRAALLLMAAKAKGKGKLQVKDLEGEWLDPYTGKALLSSWKGNVVKVWSVGEDGKDDGGATTNPSGFGPAPDVAAELPLALPKAVGLAGPRGGPPSAGSFIPGSK